MGGGGEGRTERWSVDVAALVQLLWLASWLAKILFVRSWKVRANILPAGHGFIRPDVHRCRTSPSVAIELVCFMTSCSNARIALLKRPRRRACASFRDPFLCALMTTHPPHTLLPLVHSLHCRCPPHRRGVSEQPDIGKNQPHRHKKRDPNFPPHARLLSHPQHAVHGASQPDARVVEGVVHGVGEGRGRADLVADGDGDLGEQG